MKDSTIAMGLAVVWFIAQIITGEAVPFVGVIGFSCTALICRAIEERNRT